METILELDDEVADGEAGAEPVEPLPPLQPAERPRCRGCGRNDRPVFGSVCSWCASRE